MEVVYIVCKEYNATLAKKQPWYGIKKLHEDLSLLGFEVVIISSLRLVPPNFRGRVIKLFGFKDIFKFGRRNYKLVYLFTCPIMTMAKAASLGPNVIFKNWSYLSRIFAVSFVPRPLILWCFQRASAVLVVSDTLEKYFFDVSNVYKYIPFSPNNWDTDLKLSKLKGCNVKNATFGYFGPPYLTRHFDTIVQFFTWLDSKGLELKTKLVTRIDNDRLSEVESKYLEILRPEISCVVSGFLSREELLHELLEIEVMILPFRVVMEELPIVVLESLELGIPVVTTIDCGIQLITEGRKDILILESFSRSEFQNVLDFVEGYVPGNFESILTKIEAVNAVALEAICD